MYARTPTGLAAEIAIFNDPLHAGPLPKNKYHRVKSERESEGMQGQDGGAESGGKGCDESGWRDGSDDELILQKGRSDFESASGYDEHNLLRPEMVESLFVM